MPGTTSKIHLPRSRIAFVLEKIRVATGRHAVEIGLIAGICLAYAALNIREALTTSSLLLAALLLLTVHRARRIELDLSESIVFEGSPEETPRFPHRVEDPYLAMIELEGGEYRMGSAEGDPLAYEDEKAHRVRVGRFAIAETLITRGLYRKILPESLPPWQKGHDDLPANSVTWNEALEFCNALSTKRGLKACYHKKGEIWFRDKEADGYRLPTEREWEYACRAGTDTTWFWGNSEKRADQYAWYSGNAKKAVQPVARKKPNHLGLYDMSGNVLEWCWDQYEDDNKGELDKLSATTGRRVLRGGSFFNEPWFLRSARRYGNGPDYWIGSIGFRCVRASGRQH